MASKLLNLLKSAFNLSYEDFWECFKEGQEINYNDSWALEKFNLMKYDFIQFYCNLDRDSQEKFYDTINQ